jgi:hypothetical protein
VSRVSTYAALALATFSLTTALACASPPSDPSGYYHRGGDTVHSDTFPDHNSDAGRYGRHPVGVRRPGH